MLKSLTKEGFWNPLFAKHPVLMKEFCEFIDEYKASIDWIKLLGANTKYHDLPIEMQVGIFIQFTMTRASYENLLQGTHVQSLEQLSAAIQDWFDAESRMMAEEEEAAAAIMAEDDRDTPPFDMLDEFDHE